MDHELKCSGPKIKKPIISSDITVACQGCGVEFQKKKWDSKRYHSVKCGHAHRYRFVSDEAKKAWSEVGKAAAKRNGSGYKPGSGRGKSGWFRGIWCDSSWELAFLIYHLDHQIKIKRNTDRFSYEYNGKSRYYVPDFRVADVLVEVKGYMTDLDYVKHSSCPEPLIVVGKDDIQKYLDYAKTKYGSNFIDLYTNGE